MAPWPLAQKVHVQQLWLAVGCVGRRRQPQGPARALFFFSISALVGPTLPRIPNGNGPVRGQLSAWVGTALSRFPSGNGPARGQPAAWVGPTLSRIPRGNRPARGQPAACGLLGRSDAAPGPLWTRASEGTATGTSLSSGVSSADADANFQLLAPPSGLSLRDFCTIRPEKHHRAGAIAGDVRSSRKIRGAAISAAGHPPEAPGTARKGYILTSSCRNAVQSVAS